MFLVKRALYALTLIALIILPGVGVTEDEETMLLARTLYTMGKDESYETMVMLGTVIVNRTENAWFPSTVRDVINQPQQFAHGSRYSEQSLSAARSVLMGRRTLPGDVLYARALDATEQWDDAYLVYSSGNYGFYTERVVVN